MAVIVATILKSRQRQNSYQVNFAGDVICLAFWNEDFVNSAYFPLSDAVTTTSGRSKNTF